MVVVPLLKRAAAHFDFVAKQSRFYLLVAYVAFVTGLTTGSRNASFRFGSAARRKLHKRCRLIDSNVWYECSHNLELKGVNQKFTLSAANISKALYDP